VIPKWAMFIGLALLILAVASILANTFIIFILISRINHLQDEISQLQILIYPKG
jgi:hypothetical protein